MVNSLISVLNELTDRGLTKEAADLHAVFKKVAYESMARAEALLNRANPDRNSSQNERSIAADRLNHLLKNPDRPEFGYKELATLIQQMGVQDSFDSEEFLGEVLTNAEVSVLKQLLKGPSEEAEDEFGWQSSWGSKEEAKEEWKSSNWGSSEKEWKRPKWEEDAFNSDEEKEKIRSMLELLVGGVRPVKIKRTNGTSDATVVSINGDVITFVVPVSDVRLGYKTITLSQLVEDSFLSMNHNM
jgi:hypothetical protein